ncbi:pneumococcal serine-rich repeat protein isoform X1 [Bactrocera neohumeralis]|uniref:pneumococcal serine-rich repeat protein isoform X1 n=1 Tax=Bactrocera neohumeralis TaxID=98809 RepID=UPI002165CA6B|nr:pneumococcal serine-rich repeat protein isoform X1 [Bactrocera neohumeralis]
MLPQLTVYAKIIYLLMVVISGALCTVEDYVIMSQCAHNKAIHVAAEGTVSVTDISQTQNITIVGLPDYVNNNLKIALYAKETQRYLCFNDQWKLVGMKELRDTCYFNETIVHGYFVFRSVVDLQRRVGFTHRGKAVGPKKNVNDACYLFTKIQADQFFHQHTDYFAPKSKSTKIISGIGTAPQTTTATHTTSGASARSASQRAALSAAATTATVTATAAQRNYNSNNRLLRTNSKNKRVNGVRSSNSNNNNRSSNNNQNEEYTNGHSSNLSSSSNNNNNNSNQSSNINHNSSSNLVSNSQQQVDLSQQRQHSNNSNGRTREHVRQQQQHQVRHHHNDPNLIARRQHHEHKQKRRQHQRQQQRLRSGKITSPATTTVAQERATATTTTRAIYSTTAAGAVAHSSHHHEQDARHEPQAATVANVAAKAATATSIVMKSTTTIANKRKGRRRKGRKQRKQQQPQRAQQQMLPLVAREHTKAAHTPTPTTWMWSDSPTPPLSSLSTQMLADVPSSLSPATTFGDYSGEWQTSMPTNVDATSVDTAAPSSSTPTLSTLVASDTPTPIYLGSTTDLSDGASSLTPTSDYNNSTDFTSDSPADEESSLNATFITEINESRMWPDPTIAVDEQLNSITSEQQQHFTTQNVATPVSTAESIAPTSTTWSESSEQNWSSSTTTNDTDDLETVFPSPTAIVDTESVAVTAIFSEDANVTEETQTVAEATDLYATINSTSREIEAESSSNTYNDDGNTEALTEVSDLQSTTTAQQKVYSLPTERGNIGHMWRKQSGIAASIATLLHQQLLATSASSGNVYAWRPQRGEEYSDEIIVATGRPVAAELETTTDIASGDRATWWQHHMNHSGTNFWDKGIADEVPSNGDDADLDWLKHLTKQRTASKRRHNNRKANINSSRGDEAVSQPPLQALSTSVSSLSFGKKYVAEGKSQRPSSKAHSGSNKLPAATTTAHEYSSTVATSRASSATTRSSGVITPATTNAIMNDKTLATTTTTQHLYALQQLLGNKTILPLYNPPSLVHFDGNSNHLAHTHTPTASTLSTSTSAAAPTSTTVAGDATTAVAASTTKKSIRISTQKLLATPFHQLTYVRNNAGDIDIDNMDNISVYPDLLEESGELAEQRSTERAETDATRNSRLTIVSGYLPTSATATLPESIRLAKVKINKERKRMMSLRKRHSRRHA